MKEEIIDIEGQFVSNQVELTKSIFFDYYLKNEEKNFAIDEYGY